MSDISADRQRQTLDAILYEADRAAPVYTYKINFFYLAVLLAALAVTLAPAFVTIPFDWAALYLAPIAICVAALALYSQTAERCGEHYRRQIKEQVLEKRYASRDVDLDLLAARLWTRNQRTPTALGIFFFIGLGASVAAHFWHAFGDIVLSQLTSFGAWLHFLWRILVFAFGVAVAFLGCLALVTAVQSDTKFSLDDLRKATFGPDWDMEPIDANMIQIAKEDVSLKTTLRRVETYTLESSFLGALAFSAFVTILIESDAPIGNLAWLSQVTLKPHHIELFGRSLTVFSPTNLAEVTNGHIGSAIAVFLLGGAVSLLVVLVARIQFTDAFRHAESLHAQACELNEKAEKLMERNPDRAVKFTDQVSRLLEDLEEAQRKIRPILDFMRMFRNVGLWLFLIAIAVCGLYYSMIAMLIITAIFGLSAVFFVLYRSITLTAIAKRLSNMDFRLGRERSQERAS
jgi:hypothetical protein